MDFRIDRESQVPLKMQLKGMIEYGIAFGDLVVGAPLPSVRDMAEAVGVAPMTVSLVYRDLKRDGLIETRPGAGTYVAGSSSARMAAQPKVAWLHQQIDQLIDRSLGMGIRTTDLSFLINSRLNYRLNLGRPVRVVMVGLFPEATASYAKFIAARLGPGATVEPMTLDDIQHNEELRGRAGSADLALTFAYRHRELSVLLPNTKLVSIRFIPSEATRLALASLDPMARVAVVSRFPEFLPIIKSGVQRFAAHVPDITAVALEGGRVGEIAGGANVVVYSTGAEQAAKLAAPGAQTLEYRLTPDPGDIERLVMPFVTQSGELSSDPFAQRQAS